MSDGPRSVWEWLATQDGHAFAYTVIVLLQTLTAYVGWRLRQGQHELRDQLDGHLQRHEHLAAAAAAAETADSRSPGRQPPPLDTTP